MTADSGSTVSTPISQQRELPTLDRLGVKLPDDIDSQSIASNWLKAFSKAVAAKDIPGITSLLQPDAFWRDMLALTWDFRTFEGTRAISTFLTDILPSADLGNFQLKDPNNLISLDKPYPDLIWIDAFFTFETKVGKGSGVFRLVPTASGEWKAHVVYLTLEELKGFPERIGPLRNHVPNHGMWPEQRRRETEFVDREPAVIVIGGGQGGLDVSARLKLLGVPTLIIERQDRVGNQWRGRYEALCLHDPVWYDHMPYLPFPPSWPVWTPAPKLADWLENYAKTMELDIWFNSEAEKVEKDPSGSGWTVAVKRSDGTKRTFKPRHIIFAHGFGGGIPSMPEYPGMDKFKGQIIHSSKFKSARDHIGKKVTIIGACTSAHDVAMDHYTHGVDVTIYQRSSSYIMSNKEGMPRLLGAIYCEGGPPTEIADLKFYSFPLNLLRLVHQRITKEIAEADRELLAGLQKRGFRVNNGAADGSGFVLQAFERGGGYYLDVGASQLIIDGKIKLKNDSKISHFSENGLVFEDGSELPADVVIFATGYGDAKSLVRELAGDELASRLSPVWGLNHEGELNGVWRWSGVEGLYFMMGNLAMCRFFSRHVALQIKAQEEGIPIQRYTR